MAARLSFRRGIVVSALLLSVVFHGAQTFCNHSIVRYRVSRTARANSLDSESGLYKASTNIKVRMAPDVNAPTLAGAESQKLKSGEWISMIKAGDVFQCSEMRTRDGQVYLKLADQDGWVFGKGVSGEWTGRDIVVPVPDSEALEAKARIVKDTMERQLIRDDSDKFALYLVGGALFLVALERLWEEFV
ncbi:hypothetical protein AK812_SmicGene6556 [Symbiodinium microadriaticum]|uniref:SH3b domain-containing protein n=1 Tax=Symbiodinium microadriaticum TaxID=2951 RepID=A0A1Q9EQV0_SYMMI|nr:hypothetical protein AK812_SmicGene6556 [Symbiodinium microadriaticum]CAE7884594.1 unnamed protein product [Symbiodinium sp. KB8]